MLLVGLRRGAQALLGSHATRALGTDAAHRLFDVGAKEQCVRTVLGTHQQRLSFIALSNATTPPGLKESLPWTTWTVSRKRS
jgi:hypothetical protein